MKKITTEQFIEDSRKVHGDKYDYSKVEYNKKTEKVCIICPIHGEFWQRPDVHKIGCGCQMCSKESTRVTTEDFIEKAKKIHGDKYDYSKVEYINCDTKVCIICPIHGEFWQLPKKHLCGKGCRKCANNKNASIMKHTKDWFINESFKVHGNKYDYSEVSYVSNKENVKIKCNTCGRYFYQTPYSHISKKSGCPYCKFSHLEESLMLVLEENKIDFISQYNLNGQFIDFYLPKYNIAIECQGEQHFIKRFSNDYDLEKTIERDVKKYNNCSNNGIDLIYYTNLNFIEKYNIFEKYKLYNNSNVFYNLNNVINYINSKN